MKREGEGEKEMLVFSEAALSYPRLLDMMVILMDAGTFFFKKSNGEL
jgi:hypothetical protein